MVEVEITVNFPRLAVLPLHVRGVGERGREAEQSEVKGIVYQISQLLIGLLSCFTDEAADY